MSSSLDRKKLAWIKEGIDETLKSVHHAPDEFLLDPDDTSPIAACIEPLHRVSGAVRMVCIEGATMLAQELENLAQALVEKRVRQQKEAAGILATGMLQLPGYLESLYHGQPDIPLILLPLLNDLRACQDKALLTEGEFFSPDLSITAPMNRKNKCIISGDLSTVAKKLRPGYLSGLLNFIKGEHIPESLEKLTLVLTNLEVASATDKAKQLWWIALGVVQSLYEQKLEYSITIKILLGRVDKHIQRVIEQGEEKGISDDTIDKTIKNLLYYISQSESYSDSVVQIRKSFGLDYPDSSTVEKARENLYGFNVNLIDTIAEQIKEELASIKDSLDIAMHANSGSTEGMETVLVKLGTISNALGMLGINKPKEMINEQVQFLEPKIAAGTSLSEDDLIFVATALLHVESSLSDFGRTLDSQNIDSTLPPAEYENILKAVAKESLLDIGKIKDTVEQYSLQPDNTALLDNIPGLIANIVGALNILRYELQTNLAIAIFNYISDGIIANKTAASNTSLDFLADAIIGLENFFQSILEESVSPEIGLHVASESISKLGYPPTSSMIIAPEDNKIAFEDNQPLANTC